MNHNKTSLGVGLNPHLEMYPNRIPNQFNGLPRQIYYLSKKRKINQKMIGI